jgi:hypothetical protein
MNREMFEIDHVFVCTSTLAPEANHVIDIGLNEGSSNRHPGQGTANRRIFFQTMMLEFLWVEDHAAPRSAEVRRLGLLERWHGRKSGACPFGLCLRPSEDSRQKAPFRTWKYQPAYSPVAIHVGVNSEAIDEPFLFYIPVVSKRRHGSSTEPTDHPIGVRNLTGLTIWHPAYGRQSSVMQAFEQLGVVTFAVAHDFLMLMSFDSGGEGRSSDFRPEIPLNISW